jgi:hypothetical protein
MSPAQHAVVSAGASIVTGVATGSLAAGVSCFVIGVFIDLDHYLDFWMNHGVVLSPARFLDFCYHGTSPTFVDLLHAWEYVPVLLWCCTLPALTPVAWGLTAGYVLHLLGDQLFNRHLSRWTYFVSYRLFHRFDSRKIVLYNPFLPGS